MTNNPKILITGGLGFIFSHVTEYFVRKGYEVVVIDNCSIGSHPEILDGSFKFYKEDLCNRKSLDIFFEENPHYIVHAAAITDVDFSIKYPEETMRNNVFSTLNVFYAARKLKNLVKLLYVATDEVYGECDIKKKETDIIFPRNPYSASKALGSLLRISYDNTYPELKDKTAEIRPCNIFGSRQDTRKIFPQIIKSLREGYSIPLQEEGRGYREYLYVKNIPALIELILGSGNRVYNLTLNDGYTVKDLIKKVEKITNKKVITHLATRPGHDKIYQMDNTRIKKLGWKPEYNFEEGLIDYLTLENIL